MKAAGLLVSLFISSITQIVLFSLMPFCMALNNRAKRNILLQVDRSKEDQEPERQ